MFHPHTELRLVTPEVGVGVFATAFIPSGTIVHVKDKLEIKIGPDNSLYHDPLYKEIIQKLAYTEPNGTRILSWDLGKYVNHCCHCNSLTTGFGFDIAIRDIAAGEEITDEYGLFSFDTHSEMDLICHSSNRCRKRIRADDIDRYSEQWDEEVIRALQQLPMVAQPLQKYLEPEIEHLLTTYLTTGKGYPSVRSLKYDARSNGLR